MPSLLSIRGRPEQFIGIQCVTLLIELCEFIFLLKVDNILYYFINNIIYEGLMVEKYFVNTYSISLHLLNLSFM